MKKYLLFLASAALLFVGCTKEQIVAQQEGGMTTVSFTANLENGVATKAAVDGDGAAASVNRCIMEIYYGGELFVRQYAPVDDQKKASFTAQVVSNRTYTVAFWADHVDATTDAGLQVDKYYTTNATGGLQAITINGDYIGNDDARDAFAFCKEYTIAQAGSAFQATLTRPFAQMNVITTDWDKVVPIAGLAPEKVEVTIKNPLVKFNAVTGEASADAGTPSLTYTTGVYVAPAPTGTAPATEKTLSMDYLFALADKAVIDIDWKALHSTDTNVVHIFAAVPYQRNYRTNIKGALLTTQGQWTVEVDPIWNTPDFVKVVEVADIKSANKIIKNYAETTKELEVKFTGEPNDSGKPDGESAGKRAIVTTPIQEDGSLSIEVLAQTRELYVGDYPDEYNVASTVNANHAVVNINVPESSSIVTLVINAPSKSVYINGKEVENVGTITSLDAITSQHTLIIEKDQIVKKLTIRQGGLEIHGEVDTLDIEENANSTNPVKVRTSENLSQSVFDVIYKAGEGGHDYIDRPNFSEKQNADGTWDIVPSVCKIGETAYGSLNNAVAAIPNGGSGEIIMISNSSLEKEVVIPSDKTVILELAGKTIDYIIDNTQWTALITNRGTLTIKDTTDVDGNGSGTGVITADALSPDLRPVPGYASNTITNYGTLTVKSGSIVNVSKEGAACYPIDNNSNERPVTLVIDGGRIYREGGGTALRVVCFGATNLNKVTVNGGIIESGYSGIWVQLPSEDPNSKPLCCVEINGGIVSGKYAFYDYSYGQSFENTRYLINGGQFKGSYGLYTKANVSISGGSFNCSGYGLYTYGAANVSISGGSFDGSYSFVGYGANTSISGGVFKSDVYIEESTNASITGGKFDTDIRASQTFWNKIISGGIFKTLVDTKDTYRYWLYEICDGKQACNLEESDPAYAEGYRYIVQ